MLVDISGSPELSSSTRFGVSEGFSLLMVSSGLGTALVTIVPCVVYRVIKFKRDDMVVLTI